MSSKSLMTFAAAMGLSLFASNDPAVAATKTYHLVLQLDDGTFVEPFDPYASRLASYPRVVTVVDQDGGDLLHGDRLWVYRAATGQVDGSVTFQIWNSDNDPGRIKVGEKVVVGYWAPDGRWALLYRQYIPAFGEVGAGWIYGDWNNTTRPKLVGLFPAS